MVLQEEKTMYWYRDDIGRKLITPNAAIAFKRAAAYGTMKVYSYKYIEKYTEQN